PFSGTTPYTNSSVRSVALGYPSNPVSASIQTYSDDWYDYYMAQDYVSITYNSAAPMVHETGARGKWRPKSSFVYQAPASSYQPSTLNGGKNYNTGYFSGLNFFNFNDGDNSEFYSGLSYLNLENFQAGLSSKAGEFLRNGSHDPNWIETNRINIYSPDGNPMEDQNVYGIQSSSRFSHSGSVPAFVANNAPYAAVQFMSFEDQSSGTTTTTAHSGSNSVQISNGSSYGVNNVRVSAFGTSDYSVRFWV